MSDQPVEQPAAADQGAVQHQIPDELAILPLFNTVVYPLTIMPLAVGQPESIQLIDEAMVNGRMIGLVTLKADDQRPSSITPEDFYHTGTAAIVHKLMKLPDGTLRVAVQGIERIDVEDILQSQPYYRARVCVAPDTVDDSAETEALMRHVTRQVRDMASLIQQFPDELLQAVVAEEDPRRFAYLIASHIRAEVADRQQILMLPSVREKLTRLSEIMARELQVLKLGQQIQSQVQSEMSKTQRDYLLREQLKAIRKELGEDDETTAEIRRLEEAIEAAGMSDEAFEQAMGELDRLRVIPPAAGEYGVIRTYLEWLISLPWQKRSDDQIDIIRAREVLDEDHYDLDEIKERILEFLAVRELRQERSRGVQDPHGEPGEGLAVRPTAPQQKGAILCFVGPPGVGKTSLGRSIARAMNREFIRLSLGGVHDEAEIRGHRRTYIGAMPGSILQAIRRVGVNNPIFMLDEIDKVRQDFRGDPSSALLEVLDPEQNNSFRDHYLDVAWDLSSVFFIATANTLETIPAPLRDRLEIIQLSGYTTREKLEIARRYLVPEQMHEHALTPKDMEITNNALRVVIEEYTREAGVRNLERSFAAICRKIARWVTERGKRWARGEHIEDGPIVVDSERVRDYLGKQRYFLDLAERIDRPGVVTGLVYTPVGGDIIFIEATKMPGERHFQLTGHLGEVMQESARAALSWVRAEAERLEIDPHFYRNYDIHLHVPEGAVPKDGPSAGIAMVVALASLLTGRPVRDHVAMTGEITLRGKVLPVGGVKEKVLAGHRAGIRTVILPKRNERDLNELPEDLRSEITFIFIDHSEEAVEAALRRQPSEPPVTPGGEEPIRHNGKAKRVRKSSTRRRIQLDNDSGSF